MINIINKDNYTPFKRIGSVYIVSWNPKEQENYNSFYKELLTLIENLCVNYNIEGWNYIKKDYLPIEYPTTDLIEFTKKIKEINSLYNTLKEKRVNEQNNKAQE